MEAHKSLNILGYFLNKIYDRQLLKIAQSGHTVVDARTKEQHFSFNTFVHLSITNPPPPFHPHLHFPHYTDRIIVERGGDDLACSLVHSLNAVSIYGWISPDTTSATAS